MEKKHINVVAAVILRDGKVLATQRGYGEWKDWWEFPGGKIESGITSIFTLEKYFLAMSMALAR